LKDQQFIKKQTYMKTETCKLYTAFEYFCQISSKSILNELYLFKVCAFLRHSVVISKTSSALKSTITNDYGISQTSRVGGLWSYVIIS